MSDVPDSPIATIEYRSTRGTRSVPVYAEEYVTLLLERIDALRAENEALRQDAERWKWVERNAGASSTGGCWSFRFQTSDGMRSLAEAIDAAMKATGSQ